MSTTEEYRIPAERWAKREAQCDRMVELAVEHFDATERESVNWLVTGWGYSLVEGADVRECREFLSCIASRQRLERFHDKLIDDGVLGSTTWHGEDEHARKLGPDRCRVTFTPASS